MAISPDNLQLVIKAYSKMLKHSDAQMRIKAAQCLGKMGNASIIPLLCQALEAENDLAVQFSIMDAMDAIVLIHNLTSETPMSENPGSSLPFMLNQQTRCQDNILLTQKFRKFLKP
jgi:hypothetical protein